MFVLFEILWTSSFSYFFHSWDVKLEFKIHLCCNGWQSPLQFGMCISWSLNQLIKNVSLYYWFANNERVYVRVCLVAIRNRFCSLCDSSFCVCISCQSLDLFSLECYYSLLNLWHVLCHGVFSGTSSVSSVASAFWECLFVCVCVCVCVCALKKACVRERKRAFGWLRSKLPFEHLNMLFNMLVCVCVCVCVCVYLNIHNKNT